MARTRTYPGQSRHTTVDENVQPSQGAQPGQPFQSGQPGQPGQGVVAPAAPPAGAAAPPTSPVAAGAPVATPIATPARAAAPETAQPVQDADVAAGRGARRRGAFGGTLLVLLGAWGALVPFFGPAIHLSYGTGRSWTWSAARGWYEVLPGGVVAIAGLLLVLSTSRAVLGAAALLAAAGGAWFVVGPQLSPALHAGSLGSPLGSSAAHRALVSIVCFYGLGVVVAVLAAMVLGRLSVRSTGLVPVPR